MMSMESRIPYPDYAATDGVSITRLKEIERSPQHYRHRLRHPTETAPLRLGTAAHCATLEPERYVRDFATWDETTASGRARPRNGKDWDAFKAAHEGQPIVTAAEHAHASAIAAAVRSHPTAARYLAAGDPEVSMVWQTGKHTSKGRVDWITRLDGVDVLVGLKTSTDCRPDVFGRQAARLGYAMQWAYYLDGYHAITGRMAKVVEIVVESAAPYAVAVYVIPAEVIELGRGTYLDLLAKLDECESTARWPGPVEGEVVLEIPRWAYRDDTEDDVESIGLIA